MRVYNMLISLFLIFEATVQLPQNGGPTKEVSVATENSNATMLAPMNCQTGGNISGICVTRANCNYGPGVVDFTLYNPHWYKRSCRVDQACCPFKYLIVETQSSDDVVNNFDFDDDD
ncbi:uncharacterized protein LOC126779696 [Nymphalis io]|uniref:uncharacterized protein LOC126779696 n=1 Tax=Inachis io TaxID=171585 RepID=UPI00216A18C2|nr:uncharacterized protein LOC126779696 [Nymphalis io]